MQVIKHGNLINPVLVVPKKDEFGKLTKIRVCIDPRLLNDHMSTDDHFELPNVTELLNHFANKKLFGEIDLFERGDVALSVVVLGNFRDVDQLDASWNTIGSEGKSPYLLSRPESHARTN